MSLINKINLISKILIDKRIPITKNNDLRNKTQLFINDQPQDVIITRIKKLKQQFDSLIFKNLVNDDEGFVIWNHHYMNSVGFPSKVDVVVCNQQHQVIAKYTDFRPQRFSREYADFTFFYVFKRNTLKTLDLHIGDIMLDK